MSDTCNNKVYKMAILDFWNFGVLTPKINNTLFWKNKHKIETVQIFQKTGNHVVELAVFNRCAKF